MSLATFARAALVLGSFAAMAPVVGCTAPVGAGHEDVGQGEEALPCTTCGGSSSGSSSGSSGGQTCDSDVMCCLRGSSTLAAIDAQISKEIGTPNTCGQAFAARGCGIVVTNPATHARSVSVGYSTVALPAAGIGSTGYWYEMVCPIGSFNWVTSADGKSSFPIYPANCVTQDFPIAPSDTPNCAMPVPAGYFSIDIDPIGCTGSACSKTLG